MKTLKRLVVTSTLLTLLAITTLAGETPTMPCPPGETPTWPCVSSPATSEDDLGTPGQSENPSASEAVDVIDLADTMFWALTLF